MPSHPSDPAAPVEPPALDIDAILHAFEHTGGRYRRAEVDAAVLLREEITPHLLAILERVLAAPQEHADNDTYDAHFYAVSLLGHFEERRAHRLLVDLISLPHEDVDLLFGILLTERMPAILYRTSGDGLDLLEAVVRNDELHPNSRAAAFTALTWAVVDGRASRDEVLELYEQIVEAELADAGDIDIVTLLSLAVIDLCPDEVMPTIERAFAEGLIDDEVLDLEDVTDVCADGREAAFAAGRDVMAGLTPSDPHGYLAPFLDIAPYVGADPSQMAARGRTNKQVKSRKRSKQARKARRKQRRKR